MTTYTPAPGTVAFRVIGWLEEQGATKEFNASQIANALDLDPKTITTCLQNALDTGLVFRRQKDRSHPRAPFWYSLTNHGVLQRAWAPSPVDWMHRPSYVPVFRECGRTEPLRMADAGSGVGVSAPITTPSPAVTNLPGYTLADARSKASRAVMEAIAIAPNSQRHESGAQHGGDAGNMARNTEHAAPLGGPAEGEGATAPSPGMREAKADEGAPAQAATDAPSGEGPAAADAPRARAVDPDWPVADRLLPGDYLVHKRSGIELVYGEGELQPSRVSVPNDGAKFALWCDGELTIFVGDTELTLKPAQVQRLRRLLGGGASA